MCYTFIVRNESYKWWMLGCLALAFFFNQTDRVLFGLLTIPIQKDLGLSDIQVGAVNTALFATIALVTPLAGPFGDRFSRKWIITLSLIGWSLMTIVTGFVSGFLGLVFFRSIAAGVGEACYNPSAVPLIAAHHRETRSLALSIHQSTLYLGMIVSGMLIGGLFALFHDSWRPLFWLFGACGLALGIAFVWVLKDKARSEVLSDQPSAGPTAQPFLAGVKVFFSCPSAVLIMCGAIAVVAVNNAYLAWAPKFAMAKFALSVEAAGTGTMAWHHACAFGAIFVSGWLTDRFATRWPRFRLAVQIGALLFGAPAIACFGLVPSAGAAWTASAVYGLARGIFEANTFATVFDVIAARFRSTAVGLMAMCSFLVGSLSPLFVGFMSERAKCAADPLGVAGFGRGFSLLGLLYLGGAALMAIALFRTFNGDRLKNG